MNKLADFTLQAIFIAGLLIIGIAIYFTRIVGLSADDPISLDSMGPYDHFTSVYQFEQEEKKINTRINVLKAEYASDLIVYREEIAKIHANIAISELEKREKLKVLEDIYSKNYFQRKTELIDQENLVLGKLREVKCQKYCVYQDLPHDL